MRGAGVTVDAVVVVFGPVEVVVCRSHEAPRARSVTATVAPTAGCCSFEDAIVVHLLSLLAFDLRASNGVRWPARTLLTNGVLDVGLRGDRVGRQSEAPPCAKCSTPTRRASKLDSDSDGQEPLVRNALVAGASVTGAMLPRGRGHQTSDRGWRGPRPTSADAEAGEIAPGVALVASCRLSSASFAAPPPVASYSSRRRRPYLSSPRCLARQH